MARKVFFSFHYGLDINRANVVRRSWQFLGTQVVGFFDRSLWEPGKPQNEEYIKRKIREGLQGTSVTVVLIGAETASRHYVNYEIEQSIKRGNGLLEIRINAISCLNAGSCGRGPNPLKNHVIIHNGKAVLASQVYKTYGWNSDGGVRNIGAWIEEAARIAGR